MTKFRWLLNLGIIVVVGFFLLNLARFTAMERADITPVEKGMKNIVAPLQGGATSTVQKVKDFFILFQEIKNLREENQELKKIVSEQVQQINQLEDYALENLRLKDLLEYKDITSEDFNLLTAKVIARNSNNWYDTVIINRGSNDGVQKDMPLITHQGLVGRVINVSPRASEVLLIIDQQGSVGARVRETRETPGVIEGIGDGSNKLAMIHMPHDAEIEVDHTIVTSGLGGLYPPGIRIGRVISIEEESNGLMKRATVEPFVDFGKLEEVLVILDVSKTYNLKMELEQQEEELEQ